jgi:hypothetical protein
MNSRRSWPARTTQSRSTARALLRAFVESNPEVGQVMITLRHRERYIVAWPWRPVLRTAIRAAIKPEPDGNGRGFHGSFWNHGHAIIPIRGGHLVVLPVNHELELRVAVPSDYDVRQLEREIAPIARNVGKMHDLI